jgi:hypothetical protein
MMTVPMDGSATAAALSTRDLAERLFKKVEAFSIFLFFSYIYVTADAVSHGTLAWNLRVLSLCDSRKNCLAS